MIIGILRRCLCPLRWCFPMKVAGAGVWTGLCWRGEVSLVVLEIGYLSRFGYLVFDGVRQQVEQC